MSQLFDGTQVASVDQLRKKAPLKILINGSDIKGKFHVLSQQVTAAADVQIDKTFGDDILVTSFGQKLLPMQLVCVAIPPENACHNSGAAGGDNLAKFYTSRHAGRQRGGRGKVTLISVTFDGVTFEGVLTNMTQVPHTLSDGINIDAFRYTFSIQGNFSR